MNDQDTTITWVHPGRITDVESLPEGQSRVTIGSTTVAFAARNLKEEQAVVRDVELLGKLNHMDSADMSYVMDLKCLQDYVRVGAPVMVEIDADDDDEWVIHLYPGRPSSRRRSSPRSCTWSVPRRGKDTGAAAWMNPCIGAHAGPNGTCYRKRMRGR